MQKLSGKSLLLVSFTLFSMFFGAGNLIFPPHLGAQAGTSLWPAFAGLAVSAVGLPIAGVVAVARAGGLDKLAGRVHPVFAMVFTILVYLSIGPCLAIPRTASTSFQMLVPLIGGGTGLQLAYSVLFFAAAFLVALRPEKLTDWLGRILCPALLVLIVVLFAGFSTAAVCRRTALAPDSRAGRQRGFGIPSCFPTPSMAEAIASCPKSRSNTGLSRVIPRRSRSRALAASRGAVCI